VSKQAQHALIFLTTWQRRSAFGTIMSWLADEKAIVGDDAADILRDLVSHQAIGRGLASHCWRTNKFLIGSSCRFSIANVSRPFA
jgi:hypothetical protein